MVTEDSVRGTNGSSQTDNGPASFFNNKTKPYEKTIGAKGKKEDNKDNSMHSSSPPHLHDIGQAIGQLEGGMYLDVGLNKAFRPDELSGAERFEADPIGEVHRALPSRGCLDLKVVEIKSAVRGGIRRADSEREQ